MLTAARTDPAAAHLLARWYHRGEEGLHQSLESAFTWGLRAAERGHVGAQYDTACAYNEGVGVAVNDAAATTWFEKVAEQGNPDAQFNLGVALAEGKGTPQNYELAAEWYQRAADQGLARAMVNLGSLYDKGRGVEQDHARAETLYREAIEADSNNDTALWNLGVSHFNTGKRVAGSAGLLFGVVILVMILIAVAGWSAGGGAVEAAGCAAIILGVVVDRFLSLGLLRQLQMWIHCHTDSFDKGLAAALSLWQRAANQGHAQAQRNIARAYLQGYGGYEQDQALARKYLKASAVQGDVQAISMLKEINACAHCGTEDATRVCSGCRKVRYCGADCQLAHWSDPVDSHKAHCGGRR